MEAAGVIDIYKQSIAKYNLRYFPFVRDGDSKSYATVTRELPYGQTVFILKEDCVSHVTKRMGTNLQNLTKEMKDLCN